MDFLPIFVDIKSRPCLVVGGGEVAARKVELLLRAEADVRVIAPALGVSLGELRDARRVRHLARAFEDDDVAGNALVIAATDDPEVNRRISKLCREREQPVNVVDQPALCSFIMPSIIDRSPVVVAVSTGGASPVLARLMRARLEALIPSAFGQLAELAREFREQVKARLDDPGARRRFWEKVLDGPVAEMVFAGRRDSARSALASTLEDESSAPIGEVYLVGAGPGEPDLLTSRAIRLMQRADVVVYDRLVSDGVLDLTRRDAQRIYAGKERSRHVLPQESINQLLVRLAGEGQRVLRLKGGDPFIFGRGGEEIEELAAHGIPFQIVPGITAASGCAAFAGIPLTHRDYAHSCAFVTGHLKGDRPNLNWKSLVQPQQTLVIYMGLVGLPIICDQLIRHGMRESMPAALIERGTTSRQRIYAGTLKSLPGIVERAGARAPTLTIIGEVVRLRDKLSWFEPRSSNAAAESAG